MTQYSGSERRSFLRMEHHSPVTCKVCKKETVEKLLEGYISDISQSGIFCSVNEKVSENDILWLSFDRATLSIFSDLEKRALIYQNGIIGKVVRVETKDSCSYDLGIQFITREEENLTNIYPAVNFNLKPEHDDTES
jgi:hypothetical protein